MLMFIELHLSDNNEKIMLNINRINSIYQTNGKTNIFIDQIVYRVKESYDDIVNVINRYYKA